MNDLFFYYLIFHILVGSIAVDWFFNWLYKFEKQRGYNYVQAGADEIIIVFVTWPISITFSVLFIKLGMMKKSKS